MTTILCVLLVLGFLALLLTDTERRLAAPQPGTRVEIIRGEHAGECGRIASVPWLGNLYNARPCVNVAMSKAKAQQQYGASYGEEGMKDIFLQIDHGIGPRDWVYVSSRDVRPLPLESVEEILAISGRVKQYYDQKYPGLTPPPQSAQ